MQQTMAYQGSGRPAGVAAIVSALPLWLFSIAILVEGFPRPPVSGEVVMAAFVAALGLTGLALWKRWMTVELAVYSLFPLHLLVIFDEITTTYKTPFILVCALCLCLGALAYQRVRKRRILGWSVLILTLVLVWALAWHATLGFWHMTNELGYVECFPDGYGCLPLPPQATPWWALIFGF